MPYITVAEYPKLAILPPIPTALQDTVELAISQAEEGINNWLGVKTLDAEVDEYLDFYGTDEDFLQMDRFIRSFTAVEAQPLTSSGTATALGTYCELFPIPYKHTYVNTDDETVKVFENVRVKPAYRGSEPFFKQDTIYRVTGVFGFEVVPPVVKKAVAYYANYLIRNANYSDEIRMTAGGGHYQQAQDTDQLQNLSLMPRMVQAMLMPYRLRDIGIGIR